MSTVHNLITSQEKALIKKIAADIYFPMIKSGATSSLELEDLYHLGIIGLLEARQKYRDHKGATWLTFAAYRIRGAIIDQLRKDSIIRLPQEKQQKIKSIENAREKVSQQKCERASSEEIAEELGWNPDEIHQAAINKPTFVEVNTTDQRTEQSNPSSSTATSVADMSFNPEALNTQQELIEILQRCLRGLNSVRDRIVLLGRTLEGLKLKDLAASLGCSLENIRQIEQKAKDQMQSCLNKHGWSTEGLHVYDH